MTAPILRRLGIVDCGETIAAMRDYTATRDADTPDEIWLCEHPPVYTLGVAGRRAHVLESGAIPLLETDRGGQVTYHGPGQVIAYALVDLRRLGLHVKEYVHRLEQSALRTLEAVEVTGHRVAGAPGVYVRSADPRGHRMLERRSAPQGEAGRGAPDFTGLAKIAALGIKVSRHCAYHGLALNVAMDLKPFAGIDPCGYAGLVTTDLSTIGVRSSPEAVAEILGARLAAGLSP